MRRRLALLGIGFLVVAPAAAAILLLGLTSPWAASAETAAPVPSVSTNASPSGVGVTIVAPAQSGALPPTAGTTGSGRAGSATPPIPDASTTPQSVNIAPNPTETKNRLALNSAVLHPGDTLIAGGHGFTPGEKVRFVMYPGSRVIGLSDTGSSGGVTGTTVIARDTQSGGYIIEATGLQSARIASATFVVAVASPSAAAPIPAALVPVIAVAGIAIVGVSATLIGFGGFPGIASRFLTGGRL